MKSSLLVFAMLVFAMLVFAMLVFAMLFAAVFATLVGRVGYLAASIKARAIDLERQRVSSAPSKIDSTRASTK
jgi:positive regulator of sigma E activity